MHHVVQTNIQDHDSASCCLCHILDQCIYPINTWNRTVRHKRYRTTYPWKYGRLEKGLPPPARKICPGVHQEDEPQNTIAIHQTVDAIYLGPQYNLQGGYFFESLLTGKHLWRSHCTPINMTEDVIKRYVTFNTKGCPEDLIFGDFNDQPIPSTYSDLTNDYDDDVTKIDSYLMENKGVEDAVIPNNENLSIRK